jgi:hypothetical protein
MRSGSLLKLFLETFYFSGKSLYIWIMKNLIPFFLILLASCSKEDVKPQAQQTFIQNSGSPGYLVASNATSDGQSYWENSGVPSDLIVDIFERGAQPLKDGIYAYASTTQALANGDFNLDGYVDVFNAGTLCNGSGSNLSFLIWNPKTSTYDEKNLINNGTHNIGGPTKAVPVYLNGDAYVDIVIFGHKDECSFNSPNEPVTLCLSDGKGGYDLVPLTLEPASLANRFGHEGGDVGDLNGDGLPDLFVVANSHSYIFWGTKSYPYFTSSGYAHFSSDQKNYPSDNGFGEAVAVGAGFVYTAHIADVNGDGKNDLILGSVEDATSQNRIMLNKGNGRFNDAIQLPYYTNNFSGVGNTDFIVDDINGDGLRDIISVNDEAYKSWNLVLYVQQKDGSFTIDRSAFEYTVNKSYPRGGDWKCGLIYKDFNGDGKKDIGYIDAGATAWNIPGNGLLTKSVFIRSGNSFKEQSLYDLDTYAKELSSKFPK